MVGQRSPSRLLPRAPLTGALIAIGAGLLSTFPASAQDREPGRAQTPAVPAAQRPTDSQRSLGLPKPVPSQAPTQPPAPAAGDAVRTMVSLGGVLALVGLAAFVVKRFARSHGGLLGAAGAGGRAPAGVLEVLGRYPLARGQSLILLKLDRRVLLLSQTGGGRLGSASLSTLCEITDPEEIASILFKVRDDEGESMARRFQTVLGKADRATADAVGGTDSGRRTTTNSSGDRAELWVQQDVQSGPAPGYGLLHEDSASKAPRETGAESLRRRLGSLRRLGEGPGGAGA